MSKRHFPAWDFDCDDEDPFPDEAARAANARRKIRTRQTVGERLEDELIVECPFRDRWPALEECLECASFKGYSLDPTGKQSFVSCGRARELLELPVPRAATARTSALGTPVSSVMSDPVCVRREVELEELARLFVNRGISGAPVVDEAGKPVGIVSKTDMVEARAGHLDVEGEADRFEDEEARTSSRRLPAGLQEKRCSRLTAGDLMTPVVFALPETASLSDAVALMSEKRVHRIPVVARSGEVVGVLTALDVARWLSVRAPGTSRASPAAL